MLVDCLRNSLSKFIGRSELLPEVAALPALDLSTKCRLGLLHRHVGMNEDEDRLRVLGLFVLLLRCRFPGWLSYAVPLSHDQEDEVGFTDSVEAGDLR